jgi:hypothetical protein
MFLVVEYHPDMPVVRGWSLYKELENANRKADYLKAWLPPECHEDVKVIPIQVEDDPDPMANWTVELIKSLKFKEV